MGHIVYYSSVTGNTEHFVSQLGHRLFKIEKDTPLDQICEPYVLVVPTYTGAVPKAVIRFLNEERNRQFIRGVIGGGNRNFGQNYSLASKIISEKCGVPCLYRFELRGTDEDVLRVRAGLKRFMTSRFFMTSQLR